MSNVNDSIMTVELCPHMQNVTIGLTLFGWLVVSWAIYSFHSHRHSPAFRVRKPLMTISISLGIALSTIPLCVSSYNLCNGGEREVSVYCTVISAGFLVYSLWIVSLRTWIMLFNWKVCNIDVLHTNKHIFEQLD